MYTSRGIFHVGHGANWKLEVVLANREVQLSGYLSRKTTTVRNRQLWHARSDTDTVEQTRTTDDGRRTSYW